MEGGELDSTGRMKCKLRAEMAGRSRKTPAQHNCCTFKNGGLSRHVLMLTPAGLNGRQKQGFARNLDCDSGLSYPREQSDCPERRTEVCQRTEQRESLAMHVDACMETSRDRVSITRASTKNG